MSGNCAKHQRLARQRRDAGRPSAAARGYGADEVQLLDVAGAPIDVVAFGDGYYPGITPHPGVTSSGRSLERRPPERDTDDCSADFFDRFPATPGELP